MSKRAERRHHLQVMKQRAKKILEAWGSSITPRDIGTVAAVHGAKCSCTSCGNPRRKLHEKTRQEIKQDIKDRQIANDTEGESSCASG